MEELISFLAFFGTIFGIAYVFLTTRNKERLALIEKGVEASLFNTKGSKFSIAKFILNIALLFMGIGAGIFFGNYLAISMDMNEDVMIPSMLFIFGGLGLVVGFFITRALESKEE
ncbi:DUF6249 domain-containing protein [Ekhidna sp.]|uniref:DUF6249 domain-containing protein n=1 Tax=Ekhidna sp. TaxID=2608089 RepID=UPI003C7E449E